MYRCTHVRLSASYSLETYGHGAAYAFIHTPSNRYVWLEGGDAIAFECDMEAAEVRRPDDTPEQLFTHLWSANEFDLVARPYEV